MYRVNVMEDQTASIKEEDCEWRSAQYAHEGFSGSEDSDEQICVSKQEEEEAVSIKAEDCEQGIITPDVQHHAALNVFKEDASPENDLEPPSDSAYKTEMSNLGCKERRKHSLKLKLEEKDTDRKMKRELCALPHGLCLQEDGRCYSLQCRHREKLQIEDGKKLTESLRPSSFHVVKSTGLGATSAREQMQNSEPLALDVCQENEKSSTFKSDCKDHGNVYVTGKPFICSECGKRFSQTRNLKTHLRIHTGEKPYCCAECGKRFSYSNNYQRHRKMHTGEKPYCCNECGKPFSKSSDLQIHTRVHTREKPYPCSECGRRFAHISNLKSHTTVHTGEKPFCCSDCSKQFSLLGELKKHKRIHTGVKPHCCAECGKRFLKASNLKVHSRVHTGEKTHCCSNCGKRFSNASDVQRHMKIHTGEKPYGCFECGKQFSTVSYVTRHIKIHTGEKPYSCSECGKQFSIKGNLRRHTKIHAGEKLHPAQNVANNSRIYTDIMDTQNPSQDGSRFVVLNVANSSSTEVVFSNTSDFTLNGTPHQSDIRMT